MSSSNSERSVGGGEAVDKHVEHPQLEKLKRLREIYFFKVEHHPKLFLEEFGLLIREWNEKLPNLHDFFTKEEMDLLLVASINWPRKEKIFEFVARSGYKDELDLDEDGKPLLRRTTAVHRINKGGGCWIERKLLKHLFKIYDKFHVNYTDELGYTHFYIACMYNLDDVVEKFLELGQDPNCLVPGTGDSILYHVSAVNSREATTRTLLKHGADPNQTNKDGLTPLLGMCQELIVSWPVISNLLRSIDESERTLQLNIRDNEGNTALHLVLKDYFNKNTIEELLRRGCDPNLANAKGQTPLHIICQVYENRGLLQLFFGVNDEIGNTVRIDARDNEGNTPLHLATSWKIAEVVKLLLSRGADPCLANAKGLLPQHLIDRSKIVGIFFASTNEERQQTARIDARDAKLGRTALEWAVTRCLPRIVKSLLDCGADLLGFVFPTPSESDSYQDINRGKSLADLSDAEYNWYSYRNDLDLKDFDVDDWGFPVTKLTAATGLLAIAELLETRGYELNRDDALKFMGFFDKYGLYESTDLSTSKNDDYLVDSLFAVMSKKPTYEGEFNFASTFGSAELKDSTDACSLRLCEKVSTKFFRDWALDPFMELIHNRLPILCCDMIIEELKNKDLFNICLAAAGRSSR